MNEESPAVVEVDGAGPFISCETRTHKPWAVGGTGWDRDAGNAVFAWGKITGLTACNLE